MKKGLLVKTVMVVWLTAVGLTACSKGNKTNSTGANGENKVSGEQLFRVTVQQELPSADLSLATNTISFSALNNVYEGLYRLGNESKPQAAGAAELATVSDDGLTYTFQLREDAKWSNGEPVVADDYVYGWQRTADSRTASEYAYLYESVKNGSDVSAGKKTVDELGIKAINEHELEVTLERQTPYFDYLLALPSFFPQNRKAVEEYGNKYATSSDTSVYNGPFVLTDFDGPGNDTEWSYTKNENYWDKETVQLDKIEVTVIKEAPTALNLFQDGQVDDIILSGELANQMADDPQLVIVKEARTSYLDFNKKQEDSLFKNENLRKAISYSIDRQAAVTNILRNGSIASTGLVPSGMSFSTDGNKDFSNENKKRVAYNEEKAKEHFEAAKKELGMDTLTFDILGEDTDSVKKVLEYIQASINDTLEGVKATVTTVPFSVRLDREKSGKFDVVMSGWGADYADPSSFLDLFVTGNSYNRGGYLNQEYDTLVAAASETDASDSKKRWKDMVEAESVLLEEMGVAPIYQRAEAHMVNEKIKGIVAHSAGATFDYKWAYVTK